MALSNSLIIHPKLVSGMVKHVYGDGVQYMTLIFIIAGMQINLIIH